LILAKPSAAQPSIDINAILPQLRQDILTAINYYRNLHGTQPLILDDSISASAQAWATQIANTGVFAHSNTAGLGENLYMMSSSAALNVVDGKMKYAKQCFHYC
jgi:uncharacterized protein YkwD